MSTADRLTVIGCSVGIMVALAMAMRQDPMHGQAATERENIRTDFQSLQGDISDLRVQVGRIEERLEDDRQRVRGVRRNNDLEDCLANFEAGINAGMVSLSEDDYCGHFMP